MKLVEGPSEIMRFVQKRRASSSNAECELHIRLGVWVGGKGKGDALICHTRPPRGASERGTSFCTKGRPWQQRDAGNVCHEAEDSVQCEGASNRSWQHWQRFLRPLGRQPFRFCPDFLQSKTANVQHQVQGHN